MEYGLISCIPILVLITGALITKKIGESMIVASVVGVVLVYKGNFLTAMSNKCTMFLRMIPISLFLSLLCALVRRLNCFRHRTALLDSGILYQTLHTDRKSRCFWRF